MTAKLKPLTLKEAISSIQKDTADIAREYKDARRRDPASDPVLMTESRLWRLASLARVLDHTLSKPETAEVLDGRLILAWVHIGSIVEMGMQIMLAVHYKHFLEDPNRRVKSRDGNEIDLDLSKTSLEQLRVFYDKTVWGEDERTRWSPWITTVIERRNAVHAFRDRTIGKWADVEQGVIETATFIDVLLDRFPPPLSDYLEGVEW